jgi:hypothetical protein
MAAALVVMEGNSGGTFLICNIELFIDNSGMRKNIP